VKVKGVNIEKVFIFLKDKKDVLILAPE